MRIPSTARQAAFVFLTILTASLPLLAQTELAEKRASVATPEGRALQRERRRYLIKFESDGTFRIDDVPPGKYRATIEPTKTNEGPFPARETLGVARFKVTVPEIPRGRTDDPLNVGSIDFKSFPPRQNRSPAPITAR